MDPQRRVAPLGASDRASQAAATRLAVDRVAELGDRRPRALVSLAQWLAAADVVLARATGRRRDRGAEALATKPARSVRRLPVVRDGPLDRGSPSSQQYTAHSNGKLLAGSPVAIATSRRGERQQRREHGQPAAFLRQASAGGRGSAGGRPARPRAGRAHCPSRAGNRVDGEAGPLRKLRGNETPGQGASPGSIRTLGCVIRTSVGDVGEGETTRGVSTCDVSRSWRPGLPWPPPSWPLRSRPRHGFRRESRCRTASGPRASRSARTTSSTSARSRPVRSTAVT